MTNFVYVNTDIRLEDNRFLRIKPSVQKIDLFFYCLYAKCVHRKHLFMKLTNHFVYFTDDGSNVRPDLVISVQPQNHGEL